MSDSIYIRSYYDKGYGGGGGRGIVTYCPHENNPIVSLGEVWQYL